MGTAAGIALLAALAALLWSLASRPGAARSERRLVVLVALAPRLLGAVVAQFVVGIGEREYIVPDELLFYREATDVLSTRHGYSSLLEGVFWVTGASTWLPRSINVLAGAGAALAAWELARALGGLRAARVAGFAVALWPSLVVWSSLVLKDSLTLLAVTVALLGIVIAARGQVLGVGLALPALAGLEQLRPYAFVLAMFAVAGAAVVAVIGRQPRRIGLAAALVASTAVISVAGGQGLFGATFLDYYVDRDVAVQERFNRAKQGGDTAIGTPSELSAIERGRGSGEEAAEQQDGGPSEESLRRRSEEGLLDGVPEGVLYGVFGPYPWQSGEDAGPLLLAVELPLWYLALGLAALGAVRLGPRRLVRHWTPLLVFALGVLAVIVVYEGNAGTALRQRGMALPVLLALGAAGLYATTERARGATRNSTASKSPT